MHASTAHHFHHANGLSCAERRTLRTRRDYRLVADRERLNRPAA